MAHWGERNYYGESQVQLKDVVYLEAGMTVKCDDCPNFAREKYTNPYSTSRGQQTILIGTEYQPQEKINQIRASVLETITSIFGYWFVPFDKELAGRYVRHQLPDFREPPFCVPPGLYVITDMQKYLRGMMVTCQTYKPNENRRPYTVSFVQGIFHETNIDRIRVITDPENFAE